MNIGIDIDGVLTDLEKMQVEYGIKMCIEENWPINVDASQYDSTKIFNWTAEQEEKFWNKYLVEYVTKSPVRNFAPEIIKKLQQEGNKIYLITARNETGMPSKYYGKMQEMTREWLNKYDIKYEKLIFVRDEDKLQQCIENNVKVMIEDSPKNIQQISGQIKVIKFDCQYNRDINNENVITAYSWHHIYRIIKEIEGE